MSETPTKDLFGIQKLKNINWKMLCIQNIFYLFPAYWLGCIFAQFMQGSQRLDIVTGETVAPLYYKLTDIWKYTKSCPAAVILGFFLAMIFINLIVHWLKMRLGYSNTRKDKDKNFEYSDKETYGSSKWMEEKEKEEVFNSYSSADNTDEIILGTDREDNEVVTLPSDARMNKHIAIYGASGSGKSRAFARPYIMQGAKRNESFVITDPKGELFESMAPFLRDNGYDVKVFNLVQLAHSDSWNCLQEIGGDDLKAQILADVIIQNTSSGKSAGDFWSQGEMNLLKALCLYVERNPGIPTNMAEVYNLLATKSESELDLIFSEMPYNSETMAAKMAYNVYANSGDKVKGGMVVGLGSRLQVFQGEMVRKITTYNEIDLTAPGKRKCAYFCITSDQHSAFDFLAVLFYSMLFIKLVEYADGNGGKCDVPVNFVLDEFPNIGAIPDFTKKISTVRSRGLNICVIFQNIAQLQNRYPYGQWEEILGNCDTHIFLGCSDTTTAKYISENLGTATIAVSSQSHDKRAGTQLSPSLDYKESSSIGKRALLTPEEVKQIPPDEEVIMIRGRRPYRVNKFDYSKHPDAVKLHDGSVKAYVPEWAKTVSENKSDKSDENRGLNADSNSKLNANSSLESNFSPEPLSGGKKKELKGTPVSGKGRPNGFR